MHTGLELDFHGLAKQPYLVVVIGGRGVHAEIISRGVLQMLDFKETFLTGQIVKYNEVLHWYFMTYLDELKQTLWFWSTHCNFCGTYCVFQKHATSSSKVNWQLHCFAAIIVTANVTRKNRSNKMDQNISITSEVVCERSAEIIDSNEKCNWDNRCHMSKSNWHQNRSLTKSALLDYQLPADNQLGTKVSLETNILDKFDLFFNSWALELSDLLICAFGL